MFIIVVSTLILLGLPDYALAAPSIVTSPVGYVEDGIGGFEELGGPKGITTVTIGSSTYALVAAYDDDGIQIIDITDPSNPTPVASISDGEGGFEELAGARYVTAATIGSSTYALVSASADDGVQIINVTTPSSPAPAAHISDAAGLVLRDPRGIAIFTIDSSTYALVASHHAGFQILDITDPSSPVPVANAHDGAGGFDALSRARGVTVTTLDSSTYALVASYDDGIQIINVTNPSEPVPVAAVHNSQGNRLGGATGITTVTIGSSTYALVTAQNDNAVQVINVTDPSNPEPVAFAQDGIGGFENLYYPESIATVTFGSSTYAIVAAFLDGIQIIDITDPSNPRPAASVDDFARFGNFATPEDITAVTIGSKTYALAASYFSSSVPIISVDLTYGPVLTSAALDEGSGILEIAFSDTVDVTPARLVDLSKMTIGDSGQSVSLEGATLNTETDSVMISVQLTADQSHLVAAMATPRLDVGASAVQDASGNPIDPTRRNAVTVTDDAAPEVISVTLDEETNILEIAFSDRIDATPAYMVYPGGMTISGSGQSVSLAGATLNTETDSTVISIQLTADQGRSVSAMSSPSLGISRYDVIDTGGNPIEQSSGNAISIIGANNPPTVEAGSALEVSEGLEAGLNGTASDADDDPLTYLWSHNSTLTIALDNSTALSTAFTAPLVDANTTVTFTLTANDGTDAASDTVAVTILDIPPVNAPPTVEAGSALEVSEGLEAGLNGTASDADDDPLTYLWSHNSTLTIALDNSTALSTAFTAPLVDANTTVTFTLTANDGTDAASDTVAVTILDIPPVNAPPTVEAGSALEVSEGLEAGLNGTASDADDDPLTYLWSHNSTLTIALDNSTALSTAFTAPLVDANTTVTFTLTANDGTDAASDTVAVTILDVPPVNNIIHDTELTQTFTVLEPTPPLGPRDIGRIVLNSTSPGTIEAAWDAPSEAPVDYRISWAKADESFRTWTDLTGNAFPTVASHAITGLDEGQEYKVIVRARYGGTSGDWSGEVTITVLGVPNDDLPNTRYEQTSTVAVLEPTPPLGPRDIGRIVLNSTSPGTIEAAWDAPSEAPVDYRISWAKADESFRTWTDLTGNAFPTVASHAITGLDEGQEYKVIVRARYGGTSGDWSGEITVTVARTE